MFRIFENVLLDGTILQSDLVGGFWNGYVLQLFGSMFLEDHTSFPSSICTNYV